MAALLDLGRMKPSVKSIIVLVTVCWMVAENLSAQDISSSFEACLPPTSDNDANAEDCPLTYHPPEPVGKSIDVSDCLFVPGQFDTVGQVFLAMQCSVFNGSKRRVAFFKYGVRYLEAGSLTVLLEVGFEGEQRFSTAHLAPVLQPRETRSVRLIAPGLPADANAYELDISVEVLGLGEPNGRILR